MANLFLASEIIEINVIEEHNGAAFYRALAESATSPLLRKKALEIAEQEMAHEKRFANMMEKLQQQEPAESYAGEYDAYLQKLLRNRMFSDEHDATARATEFKDIEAIEFALATEQATLNLLLELEQHIDPRELAFVQETISEEEEHVVQLKALLRQL